MHSLNRTFNMPSALLIVALVSILGYQVIGQRQTAAGNSGSCSCVVSVNLPAVLEGMNERAEAELKLKAMREEMVAEDGTRQEALKQQQGQLDALPVGDARRTELGENLTLAALEYNAWRAFASEQLDIEKSLMFRDLDRSVNAAIKELAEANGYDIVLMNDSGQQLSVNPDSQAPREVQVRQQMTSRRALYVSGVADISQELVQRMNNAYNAGG